MAGPKDVQALIDRLDAGEAYDRVRDDAHYGVKVLAMHHEDVVDAESLREHLVGLLDGVLHFRLIKDKHTGLKFWADYAAEGGRLYNRNGGYQDFDPERQEVLDAVDMLDEDPSVLDAFLQDPWRRLDWTNTSMVDPNSAYGWVAPDGTFTGCDYHAHDAVCTYIFKREVHAIEKTHLRIGSYGPTGPYGGWPTPEQIAWARANGHEDWADTEAQIADG